MSNGNRRKGFRNTTETESRRYRHDQNGEKHHHALNEISPAYGEKTADKSIKDDNESAETQRVFIRNAENSGEQFTAGNETG